MIQPGATGGTWAWLAEGTSRRTASPTLFFPLPLPSRTTTPPAASAPLICSADAFGDSVVLSEARAGTVSICEPTLVPVAEYPVTVTCSFTALATRTSRAGPEWGGMPTTDDDPRGAMAEA